MQVNEEIEFFERKAERIGEAIKHKKRLNESFSECTKCKEIVRDGDMAEHQLKHQKNEKILKTYMVEPEACAACVKGFKDREITRKHLKEAHGIDLDLE